MTDQPMDTDTTKTDLINRFAENFGLDLNSPIEAALAAQEADHVLSLIAAEARPNDPAAEPKLTIDRRFYPPTESDIPQHGWRPYSDMHRERIRAHAKHDARDGSMERKAYDNPIWLPVLMEEVGEVARVLCDNELGVLGADVRQRLREELIQVGAMTAAWIDAIDAREANDE